MGFRGVSTPDGKVQLDDLFAELEERVRAMESGRGFGIFRDYTPAWTSSGTAPAIGANGVLLGRFALTGKRMDLWISLLFGAATTAGTGTWNFSLPAGFTAVNLGVSQLLHAYARDASPGSSHLGAAKVSAGASVVDILTTATNNFFGATVPFTWTTGDSLVLQGSIEVA